MRVARVYTAMNVTVCWLYIYLVCTYVYVKQELCILVFVLQALDRMILYLRIVYSIDYYSANEYPNEDEMPHRCGIMHSRGVPPTTKITQQDGRSKFAAWLKIVWQ